MPRLGRQGQGHATPCGHRIGRIEHSVRPKNRIKPSRRGPQGARQLLDLFAHPPQRPGVGARLGQGNATHDRAQLADKAL